VSGLSAVKELREKKRKRKTKEKVWNGITGLIMRVEKESESSVLAQNDGGGQRTR